MNALSFLLAASALFASNGCSSATNWGARDVQVTLDSARAGLTSVPTHSARFRFKNMGAQACRVRSYRVRWADQQRVVTPGSLFIIPKGATITRSWNAGYVSDPALFKREVRVSVTCAE
jgi:hypothetical protein